MAATMGESVFRIAGKRCTLMIVTRVAPPGKVSTDFYIYVGALNGVFDIFLVFNFNLPYWHQKAEGGDWEYTGTLRL
jgi:hypothetical protein